MRAVLMRHRPALPPQHQPHPRHWRAGLVWALAWVLLLAALLPSALRLGSHGQDAAWTQVCTPHGMRWVAIAADAASDTVNDASSKRKSQTAMGLLDCPLCLLQHSAALPSTNGLPTVVAVQWRGQRLVFAPPALAPAPLLRHWRPPLRAPPVFSLA